MARQEVGGPPIFTGLGLVELVIDTVVCLTLAKWETVSGQFGGYLIHLGIPGPVIIPWLRP